MSDCIIINGRLMYFPDIDLPTFDYDARPMYRSIERTTKEVAD